MIYIIGSGLSAMAAAVALVRRGCRPTILDAGLTPDQDALALKSRLAATEPENWSHKDLTQLKRTGHVAANGIPRKLHLGSDFTFREPEGAAPVYLRQASMYRSFAAGGFSNVWGAVIQPAPQKELRDWPVSAAELAPHYTAVRTLLHGRLDIPPPDAPALAHESALELHPSSQADALYANLSANRRELEREGIRFGYAQLAVRTSDLKGQRDCRYCGLCLYGCPYDCRYTATATLTRLIRDGSVSYIPGMIVDRMFPAIGGIQIEARSFAGGSIQRFEGERVFVAAGLLETSRIILQSLGLHNTPFQISHSDIFTLPLVSYRATPKVQREKLHTLCQLVAEIEDDVMCSHPVHLQFYGHNDLYLQFMRRKLGIVARPLAPALNAIATRLFVIFGYLHSSLSSSIKITLSSNGARGLRLEGQSNPEAGRISQAVARKLFHNRRFLRAIPLLPLLRLDLPGGGYHSGGIFPMKRSPGAFETDQLGSLTPLPGVHLIDASVLPTVPAAPTGFTVMANAHRIASNCPVPHDE